MKPVGRSSRSCRTSYRRHARGTNPAQSKHPNLTRVQYGMRNGALFTVSAFFALIGAPIGGALFERSVGATAGFGGGAFSRAHTRAQVPDHRNRCDGSSVAVHRGSVVARVTETRVMASLEYLRCHSQALMLIDVYSTVREMVRE